MKRITTNNGTTSLLKRIGLSWVSISIEAFTNQL